MTDKLRYEDDELLLNGRSRCYLSHDFSKVEIYSTRLVVCPERLLNGKQIQEWVADLRQNPKVFATNSLYLLRELYLQKIDVEYNNDGVISTDLDALGDLEVLDREIEQSDRYLKAEN